MNSYKHFGTDGIRGKVGINPITPKFFLKFGWAFGNVLRRLGYHNVIIGYDTRISSPMLGFALKSGLISSGISINFIGCVPTPAISYLIKFLKVDAGIIISASHNQFYDNGIKIFSIKGEKFSKIIEKRIEKEIKKPMTFLKSLKLGKEKIINNVYEHYISFCKKTFPKDLNLKKLKIVVDCANGSNYYIGPKILLDLKAKLTVINHKPNGININKNCGTTNLTSLKNVVLSKKADVGISYDGDGDRLIMIDHYGNEVNGDQILYIIVKEKIRRNQFSGGVVGTFMSNTALKIELNNIGVPFIQTKVGDYYLLKKIKETGWNIGVENSGHIILLENNSTSDGIVTGLQVLAAMVSNKSSLYSLCNNIQLFPQIFINIHCSKKNNILQFNLIKKIINKIKKNISKENRILLRKSGTEPLIRIMIEGKNIKKTKEIAKNISNKIKFNHSKI